MKKVFLTLVFLLSLCLSACSTKAPPVEEQLTHVESKEESPVSNEGREIEETTESRDILANSIMQVQTDTQLGSGILWEKREEEWIVVTAAHVVEGLQEADVYLVREDKILPARVAEVNGLDLAFLTVAIASLDESVEYKYQPVSVMSDSQEEKPGVLAAGYNPYGQLCEFAGTVIEEWIYVEDFDNYMLLCDCKAEPGMSGGAVVTEEGKLVGLVCGENEKGLLAVLPVGVIKSEYQLFQEN